MQRITKHFLCLFVAAVPAFAQVAPVTPPTTPPAPSMAPQAPGASAPSAVRQPGQALPGTGQPAAPTAGNAVPDNPVAPGAPGTVTQNPVLPGNPPMATPEIPVPTLGTPPTIEAAPMAPMATQLQFDPSITGDTLNVREQAKIELLDVEGLRAVYERTKENETVRLSLQDCIGFALAQNSDILIAEFDPQIADADVYSAKGEFDPVWQTTAQYLNAQQSLNQQAVVFGGIDSVRQYQTTINSTLAGKLHTGTQYALLFDMSKEENTFGGFIEEFSTTVGLPITQPLLRGLGRDYNTYRIRAARNLRESTEWQLRLTVMNTVGQVTKAYWDVVGAVEAVKVSESSLENAKRLLTINETRRDIGTAADLEVLQAKAGVSQRQGELVTATARAIDAGDLLKQLLDLREGDFLSKARIIPLDRPGNDELQLSDPDAFFVAMDNAIADSMEHRPEIKMAELTIANAGIDSHHSRKDLLPQLDLTGSYSQGARDHKLSEAFYGTRERNDSAFTYGIQAGIPLGNRTARGTHQRAELREKQAEQQLTKVRTGIQTSVHLAVRNVETNRILVRNSEQAVQLQAVTVTAEEERLRLGVTTSWQVLQIQQTLTTIQIQELQSRIAYEKALIDLQLAKGTLLDDMGVTYEVPASEKPVGFFEAYKVGVTN